MYGSTTVEELGLLSYAPLHGKNILLGVTGSSAIYKSLDLARRLLRMGAKVRVVMTRTASKLVAPDLFHWATGAKPYVEMTGETEHIDLAKWAHSMVIAPATLNTMCKLAHGILDELLVLTATALIGERKRVIVVPSMNIRLFSSPQYNECVKRLREYGIIVVPPLIEEDKVKYPPLEDLSHFIDAVVNRGRDLEGLKLLVTAGPTREHIDPVRVITNPSSGLMGVLIAREAASRGAVVTLVHGPISINPPYMVERAYAETTEEMAAIVHEYTGKQVYDAAVFAAAPADYRPKSKTDQKISTRIHRELVLELETTPKVLHNIWRRPKIVVGFAAETAKGEELRARALEKLRDYGVDLIVANNIMSDKAGFSKDFLEALIVEKNEVVVAEGLLSKYEVARIVVDYIARKLERTPTFQ